MFSVMNDSGQKFIVLFHNSFPTDFCFLYVYCFLLFFYSMLSYHYILLKQIFYSFEIKARRTSYRCIRTYVILRKLNKISEKRGRMEKKHKAHGESMIFFFFNVTFIWKNDNSIFSLIMSYFISSCQLSITCFY